MQLILEQSYQWCAELAHAHYENFPVASLLMPKRLKKPITTLYAFARTADDIVDESQLRPEQKLQKLNDYQVALKAIEQGHAISTTTHPLFLALQDVIQTHALPCSLFFDLLHAFQQDVTQQHYDSFKTLLSYCHHSANPVGRLLLILTGNASCENYEYSDAICTALQLINFLQDLASDLHDRHRCYMPQDEMRAFGVTHFDLLNLKNTPAVQALINHQICRAQTWMLKGAALRSRLKGRFGFEIKLIVSSGMRILQALNKRENPYARPTLKKWDYPAIVWNALFTK